MMPGKIKKRKKLPWKAKNKKKKAWRRRVNKTQIFFIQQYDKNKFFNSQFLFIATIPTQVECLRVNLYVCEKN